MEKIKNGFTHGGIFHADDVFSAALLTYLYPDIKITRGFVVPEDFDGIVFDIGLGEFDHHQVDRRVRENEVPFAAFGLLWEKFGKEILGEEDAQNFDEGFIQQLDNADNTGEKNILSGIIANFNPTWNSTKTSDEAFDEAKKFALDILCRKFKYIKSNQEAQKIITGFIEKSNDFYVQMPYYVPWKKAILQTNKTFVIYPSKRGGFNAQAVPIDKDTSDLRCPFPESWRGKSQEEIFSESGINGINFCHNSGFLISTNSVETAVEACKKALEQNNK